MPFYLFALVSSEWGIPRFITDSIALIALGVLVGLPVILLRHKVGAKPVWSEGSALSDR